MPKFLIYAISILLISCENDSSKSISDTSSFVPDTIIKPVINKTATSPDLPDTAFISLNAYSSDFEYDLRYATKNNFIGQKVYDCAKCVTRKIVADSLIAANQHFRDKGFRILFFDCYRPLSVQEKMWKIMPKPGYVANPAKGSVHNRGGAVDISLIDNDGNPLDMGTDFDYFGLKAHHSYTILPDTIRKNRILLKQVMKKFGFSPIRTEWWHYNFVGAEVYPISDFSFDCKR